ncbi:hypothetical protein ACSQ67_025775 [Phaseolus vulgaris]
MEEKRAHGTEHGSHQCGEGGCSMVEEQLYWKIVDAGMVRVSKRRSKITRRWRELFSSRLFRGRRVSQWMKRWCGLDAEDYLLACGTRGCFERVAAHVGSPVDIDGATSEFEDLEFARLKVRTTVGRDIHPVVDMKINDILCRIVLEEETPSYNTCRCCSHGEWERHEVAIRTRGRRRSSREELLESEGFDAWCSAI